MIASGAMCSAGPVGRADEGVSVVPGLAVFVVDTVGAGAVFDAGFIASRLRGSAIAESLRWGSAVAALPIARPGARSSLAIPEVERLLAP